MRTGNQTDGQDNPSDFNSRSTFLWWVLLALIVVAGATYMVYRNNTTPASNTATTVNTAPTVGDNNRGFKLPEGNARIEPIEPTTNNMSNTSPTDTTTTAPISPDSSAALSPSVKPDNTTPANPVTGTTSNTVSP